MQLSKAKLADALNEWMARYIENPEEFQASFQTVGQFLSDAHNQQTPGYGETAAAFLEEIDPTLFENDEDSPEFLARVVELAEALARTKHTMKHVNIKFSVDAADAMKEFAKAAVQIRALHDAGKLAL